METSYLKDIGLSENEIKIYLKLLEAGESLASEIAEKTNINRTLTYQILNNLIKRGIVGYVIKNNIKYFKAAHPSKLINFLKEKETNIQEIIPELLNMAKQEEKRYSVEMYEGKEGLKTIMNDIIRTKPDEWLDITSGKTTLLLQEFYMEKWEKLRVKAGIRARFLVNDTEEGKKRAKELKKLKLSKVKFMPKDLNSPSHIYIYKDKIAITLWTKDFPFGVLIESKEVSNRFREFFNWFWKLARK